jgi:hypothetical protein
MSGRIGHGVGDATQSNKRNSPLLAHYPDPVSPLRIGPGKPMPNVMCLFLSNIMQGAQLLPRD